MIRSHDIRMNSGFRDAWRQLTRMEEIINSPTGIIDSSISHGRPPGVGSLETRISLAKNIYESQFEEFLETMTLLERESVFAFILFPVFQINWLVGDIEISAKYNWFMGLKLRKEDAHSSVPLLTV